MNNVVNELRQLVNTNRIAFAELPESVMRHKADPEKWSRKEIVGHLIDSAHNNLRRFMTAQYEETPPRIWYEQDFWVAQNQYQEMSTADLVQLWALMNERICVVLSTMDSANYGRMCDSGHGKSELHSLEFLATDYIAHMKHHLKQIFTDGN